MPGLSRDPAKRANSLANLKKGWEAAAAKVDARIAGEVPDPPATVEPAQTTIDVQDGVTVISYPEPQEPPRAPAQEPAPEPAPEPEPRADEPAHEPEPEPERPHRRGGFLDGLRTGL